MFFFVVYHKRTVSIKQRIDNYVIRHIKIKKKSFYYTLFNLCLVLIDGTVASCNDYVLKNSIVSVFALCLYSTLNGSMCARKIDRYKAIVLSNTLHIGDNFIFVNKTAGSVTQKDKFVSFCLLKVLRQLYGNVYPVHRLDKQTTGCMVFARTLTFLNFINVNFYNGSVHKKYYVIVDGVLHGELYLCVIQSNLYKIQKMSLLKLRVVHNFSKTTLVEILLITGRKHQIRISLFFLSRSIIGEFKYKKVSVKTKLCEGRLLLHCRELTVPLLNTFSCVTVQASFDYFFCNFVFLLFLKDIKQKNS